MSKKNGFTILELLVTMAVFAVVAAAAVALFQFQSKQASGSNARKLAGEAVTLAMMTIQRDIERAGMGLLQQEPLSMVVVDGGSGTPRPPDRLYLNFSDHVSMDLARDKPYSFFDIASAAGVNKLWWSLSGSNTIVMNDVGAWIGTDATAPPIGGVIRQVVAPAVAPPTADDLTDFRTNAQPDTRTPDQKNKNQCTATLTLPASYTTGNVAPAVSYKLVATAADQLAYPSSKRPQLGTLLRNGIPVMASTGGPAGVPLVGAWQSTAQGEKVPVVKVTDFQVRLGFRTPNCNFAKYYEDRDTTCWAPENGRKLGDPGWEIDNLRVVEVTIRYIVRDKGGGANYPANITTDGFKIADDDKNMTPRAFGPWALGGAQTITVAPRNIVLGHYLGPPR